jgi:asparagine synthase (glutamine-hydrolysing)
MLQRIKRKIKRVTGRWGGSNLAAGLAAGERALVTTLRGEGLTYLSEQKLAGLLSTCRSIEEARLPGIFVEAGCALGGSAILIASVKSRSRPFFVYDVFGMIPPPTKDDTKDVHERYKQIVAGKALGLRGNTYYGYQDNLQDLVQANLERFGIDCQEQRVALIKGLVQDTMQIEQPVAFAHVAVDWYEPVLTCLQRVFPHLVIGGSIILDDYHDWGGCRKATDEYLQGIAGQYALDDAAESLKITRVRR